MRDQYGPKDYTDQVFQVMADLVESEAALAASGHEYDPDVRAWLRPLPGGDRVVICALGVGRSAELWDTGVERDGEVDYLATVPDLTAALAWSALQGTRVTEG